MAFLVNGKETKSTVLDDFKVSLQSDNPHLKLPFKVLKTGFRRQESSSIWVRSLTLIIRFLPNIITHILGWRWDDVIQRKVAVRTTQIGLGNSWAFDLLVTTYDTKMWSVA
jgi:hypothetical protein